MKYNFNLRIIPLGGGPGMVTNNMYLYQYGKEAIIVDCGIGFPDDKESNDILIPDVSYLLNNPDINIKGIILSHGHDDHHAALPHILPKIGNHPIHASRLTAGFATDRLKDFKLNQKITVFKESDQIRLGSFTIHPIHVTHSVPDTFHFVIETPVGNIYHGTDYKFDLTPIDHRPPNFQKIVNLSQKGILCLISDCLRGERTGFTPSESTLTPAIHREFSNWPGRLIFTTMSSQIHRIQQAVDVAISLGRKICFIGRSMERNTTTATKLGFLKVSVKALIKPNQLKRFKDNQVCVIIAGSQGQESSSLTRFAAGTHRTLKLKLTDKIIFSSDIIPGNEALVYKVLDQIAKVGATVNHSEMIDDLHVSGHASAGEIQLLMELVNARYVYPLGGSFRHMRQYEVLAKEMGYHTKQIIMPKTAQVLEFDQQGNHFLAETIEVKEIRIDQNKL
ncbi:MAG: ribonuclease J [Candidatus Beckwithbacteria bacterium]